MTENAKVSMPHAAGASSVVQGLVPAVLIREVHSLLEAKCHQGAHAI